MQIFALSGTDIWSWVVWGNEQLRNVAYYASMITFLGVVWQLYMAWRASWQVQVFAVNDDDKSTPKENLEIGRLPRRLVTRAEINGLTGQAAGGKSLDLTRHRFNYKIGKTATIALPAASFALVKANLSAIT